MEYEKAIAIIRNEFSHVDVEKIVVDYDPAFDCEVARVFVRSDQLHAIKIGAHDRNAAMRSGLSVMIKVVDPRAESAQARLPPLSDSLPAMNKENRSMPEAEALSCERRLLDGQVVLLGRTQLGRYAQALQSALPELAVHMDLRGYDWVGRPIGLATENGAALIYDGAFDELMEFDAPGGRLLASPLFDPSRDCFGVDEYRSFLKRTGLNRLELGWCAGFTIPPQLGGEVSASNLELYEVPFYWDLVSMLGDAIGGLPEGSVLRSIEIK